MNFLIKENCLTYETYYMLRESVGWNNWSREQAEKALKILFILLQWKLNLI